MMDMYGNHVIQSFLNAFKAAEKPEGEDLTGTHQTNNLYTEFIFRTCIKSCIEIGNHKHGGCVMQRCLETGSRA
jgi:hypothetical protein